MLFFEHPVTDEFSDDSYLISTLWQQNLKDPGHFLSIAKIKSGSSFPRKSDRTLKKPSFLFWSTAEEDKKSVLQVKVFNKDKGPPLGLHQLSFPDTKTVDTQFIQRVRSIKNIEAYLWQPKISDEEEKINPLYFSLFDGTSWVTQKIHELSPKEEEEGRPIWPVINEIASKITPQGPEYFFLLSEAGTPTVLHIQARKI